jgi:hypothetical protein
MRNRWKGSFLFLMLASSTPLLADNLAGADQILCTAVQATRCFDDGECVAAPPWLFNMPQFVVVDFQQGRLATTQASGENRSTPIQHLERAEGTVFVQGVERGRAFSFVIVEETGMLSAAVAADGISVSVFGACTPLPSR